VARHSFQLTPPSVAEAQFAAAFAVLLHRYNAQSSILLNASRASAAGGIRWSRSFELSTGNDALWRNVLRQAVDLLRRADAPAGGLDALEPRTERSRAAITFLEPAPGEADDGPEAQAILMNSAQESGCDDLHLVVGLSRGRWNAAFLYNPDLFKRSSVERFAGHLRELSAHIAADPDAPISTLPLLAPEERRWIESVCSGRERPPAVELVHRSFEARAAAAPEATAVRYRGQSLTYRQLNSRANALARYLTARGVGAEAPVAACLEPSFDIAIALLAILKAGAIYVPLDPAYPAARIRASLEDIQPRLVITRSHLKGKGLFDGVQTAALDEIETLAKGLSEENLDLDIGADQTAYIYYTSGTTGKPKGAAASHANLASYIRAARERYRIDWSDVMPAIARFSFSISMFELMSPLAAGGTLIILDREHVLDLDRMSRTLAESTFFHAGPSLLKNLIAHIKRRNPDFSAFARVRHASSGGDMIPPEVLEGLKEIFFNAEVFVIYGCSEISCMGCTYPVPRDRPLERTYVGRPFDNMVVRVLDSALNLLPVGIVGEIHFAGDGIVKGYLNRPDLTAERFVDIDGRRFYRTGDLGRLSEDGWLEIVGRSDFQVKLRGMRVELGEVEHHLRRAAGVRDGVVATRRLAGDEKSLVAYIVMDRGGNDPGRCESDVTAVHRHMAEHLPDYMLPAAYVELESLPLNHNMKVDRRALPEPEASDRRLAGAARFREPRTRAEKSLASLWMKLLSLDRVGLDDHFFDLGGHSVLGITLILEVERELGVVLTGMEVLRESLEGQASICDRRLGKSAAGPVVLVKPEIASTPADDDFEPFYFGRSRSLYGVLHGGAGSGTGRPPEREAVLICPSVGQEHFRAHFILRRLAERLAARGVPALRFDYFGCGDSLGESNAATCGRWRSDIGEAYRELKRRTGASRITAVGARLGAALLVNAAEELDLAGLVLWDPVIDGAKYRAELAETHERYAGGWRRLFRRAARVGAETELLGLVLSEDNARELEALTFAPDRAGNRRVIKWLATSDAEDQKKTFRALARDGDGSRLETMDFDAGWSDLARLNHLLPDVGVSSMLAALAVGRP
jgi:amino acid adenylation domain-containing protein